MNWKVDVISLRDKLLESSVPVLRTHFHDVLRRLATCATDEDRLALVLTIDEYYAAPRSKPLLDVDSMTDDETVNICSNFEEALVALMTVDGGASFVGLPLKKHILNGITLFRLEIYPVSAEIAGICVEQDDTVHLIMDTTLIDLEARIYFWAYGPLSQNDEFIRTKFGIGSPVTVEKDGIEFFNQSSIISSLHEDPWFLRHTPKKGNDFTVAFVGSSKLILLLSDMYRGGKRGGY